MHIKPLAVLLAAVAISASAFCFAACAENQPQSTDTDIVVPGISGGDTYDDGEPDISGDHDDPGDEQPSSGDGQTGADDPDATDEEPDVSHEDYEDPDEEPYEPDEEPDEPSEPGHTGGTTQPAHTHSLQYVPALAAGCTSEGNIQYWICTDCGKYFADGSALHEIAAAEISVPASGHAYEEEVVAPTCAQQGYTVLTCTVCGESTVDGQSYVDALPHTFGEWEEITPATCTGTGERVRYCTECGTVENDVIPALGHDYRPYVISATCINGGYTEYKCADCGDSYIDELSATSALGHDFGEWIEVTPATCTEEGERVRYCSRCGLSQSEEIHASGHKYAATTVPATCTEDGYTEYKCADCGDSYISDVVPSSRHDFGEWIEVTPATCTAAGEQVKYCKSCGAFILEAIPVSEHEYVATTISATCAEEGYTEYKCADCGDSYITDVTSALGHDFGEWEEVTPPTCSEEGERVRYCSRGDFFQTQTIPASGHRYTATIVPATCTQEGYTEYKCTACGASYTSDIVPALRHNYGEWETAAPATCTSAGERVSVCTRCGDAKSELIPALEHTYAATIHAAACTEGGYTEYICSLCGNSYTDDYTTELGHDYQLSAQTEEYAEYVCTRCGDSYRRTIERPQPAASALTYKLASDYLSYIVTGIEDGADVETLVIPDEHDGLPVTAIAAEAFSANVDIVCAVLGENIVSIGDSAFENCSSLKSVNIPGQVTYIGYRAFRHCTALEQLQFDAAAAGDCYEVLYNAGADGAGITVTFGADVEAVPSNMFNVSNSMYAPKLVAIEFAEGCRVSSIGDSAFFGCTGLLNVSLPAGVAYVGYEAFCGCSSLVYAAVPASAEVMSGAFSGVAAGFELDSI